MSIEKNEEFRPKIVAFCCNWCSYAGADLAELLGIKNPGKGLKVQIEDGKMTVDVIIMVRYGCNVVGVAQQVQDAVTQAVESMAGMGTPVVNVHVSGVAFDK